MIIEMDSRTSWSTWTRCEQKGEHGTEGPQGAPGLMGPEGLTGRNGSIISPGKKGSIGHHRYPGVQGLPGPGHEVVQGLLDSQKDYKSLQDFKRNAWRINRTTKTCGSTNRQREISRQQVYWQEKHMVCLTGNMRAFATMWDSKSLTINTAL